MEQDCGGEKEASCAEGARAGEGLSGAGAGTLGLFGVGFGTPCLDGCGKPGDGTGEDDGDRAEDAGNVEPHVTVQDGDRNGRADHRGILYRWQGIDDGNAGRRDEVKG